MCILYRHDKTDLHKTIYLDKYNIDSLEELQLVKHQLWLIKMRKAQINTNTFPVDWYIGVGTSGAWVLAHLLKYF